MWSIFGLSCVSIFFLAMCSAGLHCLSVSLLKRREAPGPQGLGPLGPHGPGHEQATKNHGKTRKSGKSIETPIKFHGTLDVLMDFGVSTWVDSGSTLHKWGPFEHRNNQRKKQIPQQREHEQPPIITAKSKKSIETPIKIHGTLDVLMDFGGSTWVDSGSTLGRPLG